MASNDYGKPAVAWVYEKLYRVLRDTKWIMCDVSSIAKPAVYDKKLDSEQVH